MDNQNIGLKKEQGVDFEDMQKLKRALPSSGLKEIANMTGLDYNSVYQEFTYPKKRAEYRREIIERALHIIDREISLQEETRNFLRKKLS